MRALSLPVLNHAGRLAFFRFAISRYRNLHKPFEAIYHFNKLTLRYMPPTALFLAAQNLLSNLGCQN